MNKKHSVLLGVFAIVMLYLSSMNQVAISVKGISKKYTIGKRKDGSLRGTLAVLFSGGKSSTQDFWALKDVSFDIKRGDVVGIIGKNGAGKSTVLKVLSQITRPTQGKIEINGRVASLLEVGTGFHPELTGRENVYLNGTILGMTRKEVAEKFDEIVAFSGIEKFIDTPVKHYSSGMYVRLAFAVAAHLEPEILIIDEVLAVGDAEFQKKCLGKMKDVAGEGRTVIFVSHDLGAVRQLCNKGILMQNGTKIFEGEIDSVIEKYNANTFVDAKLEYDFSDTSTRNFGNHFVTFNRVIFDKKQYSSKDSITILTDFIVNNESIKNDIIHLNIYITDQLNNIIYHINTMNIGYDKTYNDTNSVCIHIPELNLVAGLYNVNLHLLSKLMHFDYVMNEISLLITEGSIFEYKSVFSGRVYKEFSITETNK